ncbi:MAG: bifunctional 4-hydroxy-3-methylbut-2-enyl diphosphate reductase/30S ribosomal protein S1 [Eubacteriales bacterium]|nr:bifunctional 4-hydroxy-3-methylbut-2-enyl diphosphate reductase/30S ribosomal protein S1 [Eubacteriales bacterium]
MPVLVAKHAGFCMGVRRAVVEAMKAAETEKGIVTIGELVHNPEVIRKLEENGVRAVDSPAQANEGSAIIRSHGVAPAVYRELDERRIRTIDLTCPYVKRLHDIVAGYSETGKPVILVGRADHPEVVGTIGWCGGSVYTIHDPEGAQALPELAEALAVAQTTFPHEAWESILPVLRRRVKNLTVEDTICTATVLRQNEARQLAAQVDAMLVVGGLKSANTRKLYETCKRICKRTLLVERAADIPPGFADVHTESIGITAGASTPDWSLKEVVTRMTDKEQMDQKVSGEEADKNSFMADVEATLVKIRPGQTVTGTVVQITDDEVCVNIGFKSDGLIKREDLVTQDVKLGDEIEVEVVKVNDGEGNVLLSQRNILTRKAFAELVEKYEKGEFVEGVGKEVVKGGLICNVEGIRAFVPASQLSNRYVEKIGEFVGQTLKLKIIEVDDQKRRVVASRKAVIKEEATARKAEVWSSLHEGDVIKGIVRRLTDFGAFVDIGGVDGLIHVTDLSWAHVRHPSEIVHPDQEMEVKILSLDPERERIQLGLKQMQPKPWDLAPEKYPEGAVVTGKVVRITTFGAFVELEPGVDGLVHISQCALTRINKVEDAVNVGDVVNVKVLSVDPEAKRISLSIRALLEDERKATAEPEEAAKADDGEEAVAVDIEAIGQQLEDEAKQGEADAPAEAADEDSSKTEE